MSAKEIHVIKVPNILYDPALKKGTRGEASGAACIAVWVALCLHTQWEYDEDKVPTNSKADTCFPSLKTLTEESHLSRKTVLLALEKLEDLGYVKKHCRYSGKGAERTSNSYELFAVSLCAPAPL